LYSFLLLSVIEIVIVPLSMVLFNYSFTSNPWLIGVVFILGTLDFALVGATVSGLIMYTESKTILIPLLTLPLVLPVMLPSVTLTQKLIYGIKVSQIIPELITVVLSVAILLLATMLVFDYIFLD